MEPASTRAHAPPRRRGLVPHRRLASVTVWRVRWGNDRFARLNEFPTELEAKRFANGLARTDSQGRGVVVVVEEHAALTGRGLGPR